MMRSLFNEGKQPEIRYVLDQKVIGSDAPVSMIALHGGESSPDDMTGFLEQVRGGRSVVVPRSARWSGLKQYSWFMCVQPPQIDPVSAGDSLRQLEMLLWHTCDDNAGARPLLLGVDQGAAMALLLAAHWPELVGGVVAVAGFWPVVPGLSVPPDSLRGMPILLMDCAEGTAEEAHRRGATVTFRQCQDEEGWASMESIERLRNWMEERVA